MEPPGKKSGCTTKESVLMAMRLAGDVEDSGVTEVLESRIAKGGNEQVLDELIAKLAAAAVSHNDGGVADERQRA